MSTDKTNPKSASVGPRMSEYEHKQAEQKARMRVKTFGLLALLTKIVLAWSGFALLKLPLVHVGWLALPLQQLFGLMLLTLLIAFELQPYWSKARRVRVSHTADSHHSNMADAGLEILED